MMQIRPVSDLRNKFSEIENIIISNKSPVFLTKNGKSFLFKAQSTAEKHTKSSLPNIT